MEDTYYVVMVSVRTPTLTLSAQEMNDWYHILDQFLWP